MKIAIFVHCFFPDHFYGTETYTLNIAAGLIALGHSVTVVTAVFCGEASRGQVLSTYAYRGIDVLVIDKNFLPNACIRDTYYQPDLAPVLRRVLTRIRPDVIHVTHLINHTAVLLDLASEMGIPAVATLTDFYGFCFTNRLEDSSGLLCGGPSRSRSNCIACYLGLTSAARSGSRRWNWLRRYGALRLGGRILALGERLRLLSAPHLAAVVRDLRDRPSLLMERYNGTYRSVVAPTAFLAGAYRAHGLQVPIHTLWFGVDTDRAPKPARAPGEPLCIGYIGQLAAHKGVDLLLEAFAHLQPGLATLLVYGPLDQDPVFAHRLQEMAGEHVQFLATFPPEQMADVMRRIDVLVIPSRWYENSPLVLLDALATHTPVVVSQVEGLTEFLREGVNGFGFARGSASDLTRVLQLFLTDPGLASRLAATTSFERNTAAMAQELVPIYREACGIGLA